MKVKVIEIATLPIPLAFNYTLLPLDSKYLLRDDKDFKLYENIIAGARMSMVALNLDFIPSLRNYKLSFMTTRDVSDYIEHSVMETDDYNIKSIVDCDLNLFESVTANLNELTLNRDASKKRVKMEFNLIIGHGNKFKRHQVDEDYMKEGIELKDISEITIPKFANGVINQCIAYIAATDLYKKAKRTVDMKVPGDMIQYLFELEDGRIIDFCFSWEHYYD